MTVGNMHGCMVCMMLPTSYFFLTMGVKTVTFDDCWYYAWLPGLHDASNLIFLPHNGCKDCDTDPEIPFLVGECLFLSFTYVPN